MAVRPGRAAATAASTAGRSASAPASSFGAARPVEHPHQDLVAPEADAPRRGVALDLIGGAVHRLERREDPLLEGALGVALALVEDPRAALAQVDRVVGLVADEHDAGPLVHVGVVGDVDRQPVDRVLAGSTSGRAGMNRAGSTADGSSA